MEAVLPLLKPCSFGPSSWLFLSGGNSHFKSGPHCCLSSSHYPSASLPWPPLQRSSLWVGGGGGSSETLIRVNTSWASWALGCHLCRALPCRERDAELWVQGLHMVSHTRSHLYFTSNCARNGGFPRGREQPLSSDPLGKGEGIFLLNSIKIKGLGQLHRQKSKNACSNSTKQQSKKSVSLLPLPAGFLVSWVSFQR